MNVLELGGSREGCGEVAGRCRGGGGGREDTPYQWKKWELPPFSGNTITTPTALTSMAFHNVSHTNLLNQSAASQFPCK